MNLQKWPIGNRIIAADWGTHTDSLNDVNPEKLSMKKRYESYEIQRSNNSEKFMYRMKGKSALDCTSNRFCGKFTKLNNSPKQFQNCIKKNPTT